MSKHLQFTFNIQINYFNWLHFLHFKKIPAEQLVSQSHKLKRMDEEVIFPLNSLNSAEKLVT